MLKITLKILQEFLTSKWFVVGSLILFWVIFFWIMLGSPPEQQDVSLPVTPRYVTELCKVTFYHDESDNLTQGMIGFGETFTGVKTHNGIIAIDPVYWSKKLGLPFDKQGWSQRKEALAPIFWKTVFIDVDNNKVFLPRDIGGKVIGRHTDVWVSKEYFQKHKKVLGTHYRKFLVVTYP